MKKLAYKLGAGLVSGTTAALLFASPVLAAGNVNCSISGNGGGSFNWLRCRLRTTTVRVQRNFAHVSSVVIIASSTGDNDANNNTGGDVDVTSGDATASVVIVNTLNQNN